MKTKFTDGPWILSENSEFGYAAEFSKHVIEAPSGFVLAAVISDRVPEAKANSDLITSAPDLYAACESAVEYLIARNLGENAVTLRNKICAALAKARGETP